MLLPNRRYSMWSHRLISMTTGIEPYHSTMTTSTTNTSTHWNVRPHDVTPFLYQQQYDHHFGCYYHHLLRWCIHYSYDSNKRDINIGHTIGWKPWQRHYRIIAYRPHPNKKYFARYECGDDNGDGASSHDWWYHAVSHLLVTWHPRWWLMWMMMLKRSGGGGGRPARWLRLGRWKYYDLDYEWWWWWRPQL